VCGKGDVARGEDKKKRPKAKGRGVADEVAEGKGKGGRPLGKEEKVAGVARTWRMGIADGEGKSSELLEKYKINQPSIRGRKKNTG